MKIRRKRGYISFEVAIVAILIILFGILAIWKFVFIGNDTVEHSETAYTKTSETTQSTSPGYTRPSDPGPEGGSGGGTSGGNTGGGESGETPELPETPGGSGGLEGGEVPEQETVYYITYNLNGGTQVANPVVSFKASTETFALPIPTMVGATFMGWYDNSGFNGSAWTQVPKGTAKNLTFYAKWETAASPTTKGCQFGPTEFGVSMTEQNTICWDRDISKYPRAAWETHGTYEDPDTGIEYETNFYYVKVSNKYISGLELVSGTVLLKGETFENGRDGSNQLIKVTKMYEGDQLIDDQNNFDISTLQGNETFFIESSFVPPVLIMHEDNLVNDFSSAGIYFRVLENAETGEIILATDSLTVEGVDFTGTSTRYPDIPDGSGMVISNNELAVYYDGSFDEEDMILWSPIDGDEENLGGLYLAKASDMQNKNGIMALIAKATDSENKPSSIGMYMRAVAIDPTGNETYNEVSETFSQEDFLNSIEASADFVNLGEAGIIVLNETEIMGVTLTPGFYVMHIKLKGDAMEIFGGMKESYANYIRININY